MSLKCEQGHDVLDTQKFCGECGSKVAVGDDGTCESCQSTLVKGMNFCGNCGTPRGPIGGDLNTALDEVDSYLKARAGLTDDLRLPEIDPTEDTETQADIDRILKAAAVTDSDTGDEIGVDAVPVVTAFLKGQGDLAIATRAYMQHITELVLDERAAQTAMLKAVSAMGRKLEAMAAAPAGPRLLGPAPAGLGAERPRVAGNGAAPVARGEFDALRGVDLLAKATVLANRDPSLLSTIEMATVEHFGNNDASLADIREIHPDIAARLESALRTQAAH